MVYSWFSSWFVSFKGLDDNIKKLGGAADIISATITADIRQ
jgi:hypothetical protein